MEGQYITPLNLDDGFAPTKVTFGVDFPGCEGKLEPIKVSYHNIDWFEPGRKNTFRQFQNATDVNSHLVPMCVCLRPIGVVTPCEAGPLPGHFAFEGIELRTVFQDGLNLMIDRLSEFFDDDDQARIFASATVAEQMLPHVTSAPFRWGMSTITNYGFQVESPEDEYPPIPDEPIRGYHGVGTVSGPENLTCHNEIVWADTASFYDDCGSNLPELPNLVPLWTNMCLSSRFSFSFRPHTTVRPVPLQVPYSFRVLLHAPWSEEHPHGPELILRCDYIGVFGRPGVYQRLEPPDDPGFRTIWASDIFPAQFSIVEAV